MEPIWYKDAIVYETHVKAFFDSDRDGFGDFTGLCEKLDYIHGLGVTCICLLPFFPSPMLDDGYDIADFTSVHPAHGTIDTFRSFLDEAHARELKVILDVVINHTSDQHSWFQRARTAPPGTSERDFYVWSETERKYEGARIIFPEVEKSNWSWDRVANAYYWHRFQSHQPDLNFDNPAVLEEVIAALKFWLDVGVDGFRLDALPFLFEREGTSCESLPETHEVIRRIRKELDAYGDRVICADANLWPEDLVPYFGSGNACHMAFNYALMPRMFMAIRLEDRHPITEIMARVPEIPAECQWGFFLRNHNELTLELVTDEERDYMYMAYSAEPAMRLNIGIRRRLAPLVENNRRRIELLNGLLLSLPGTPFIYYGDEIGMGDNIYLGDRSGIRTPMQWNANRNGGFSRASPGRLYSPSIMDPIYGYQTVNVENQMGDASSLLFWMQRIIALRKGYTVFGRGNIRFLPSNNRRILSYLVCDEHDRVLVVANLARFAQAVELDLVEFAGTRPVEMFGNTEFPTVGQAPYVLTLNPYGFFWFLLRSGR